MALRQPRFRSNAGSREASGRRRGYSFLSPGADDNQHIIVEIEPWSVTARLDGQRVVQFAPPHRHANLSWWQWIPVINYWPAGASGVVTGPATKFQVNPTWNSRTSTCDYRFASSPRAAGILVCMGDGSCRLVSSGVSGTTWWAAMPPNGGEVLGSDW